MYLLLEATSAALGLFIGMLLSFALGRRLGLARLAAGAHGAVPGSGPVEAAVLGLLGLLLAFAFSGAASRFENRRHLITQEANAIGTAYLRVDLLPPDVQAEIRPLFRHYLDARLTMYRQGDDEAASRTGRSETEELQRKLWSVAVAATRRPEAAGTAPALVLSSLNEMFDVTTTRAAATRNHPPLVIYLLLVAMSLVSALLVGHGMAGNPGRNWFHPLIVSLAMALTLYVILDLEFPRAGLIRVDAADRQMAELRESMK